MMIMMMMVIMMMMMMMMIEFISMIYDDKRYSQNYDNIEAGLEGTLEGPQQQKL